MMMAPAGEVARRWIASNLRPVTSVCIVLAAWEAAARLKLAPPLFLPSVTAVIAQVVALTADGSLPADLGVGRGRTFAGLAIAMACGVAFGLAMARNRIAYWLPDQLVSLGFPTPKIAFIPVVI